MIELNPETACVLYLGLAIAAVIGVWIYQHFNSKKKEIIMFSEKKISCEFCATNYIDDANKSLSRCPECHSLNKNISSK